MALLQVGTQHFGGFTTHSVLYCLDALLDCCHVITIIVFYSVMLYAELRTCTLVSFDSVIQGSYMQNACIIPHDSRYLFARRLAVPFSNLFSATKSRTGHSFSAGTTNWQHFQKVPAVCKVA
jgi:hypothetical protein